MLLRIDTRGRAKQQRKKGSNHAFMLSFALVLRRESLSSYPEKTCEIDRLVRSPMLVKAALEGRKVQQRRDGVYGYPDEVFELDSVQFRMTSLTRERLGNMSDQSAQDEGFADLAAYKALILRMHKGMKWNEESLVWVHSFERIG